MKPTALTLIVALLAVTCPGQPVKENAEGKRNQVAASPDQQKLDAIFDELHQIRLLRAEQNKLITQRTTAAQAPSAPPMEKVSLPLGSGWYSMGSENAPVTVMEFADFQCPYCRRFHTDSFAELKKNYIDTGKVGSSAATCR